MASIKRWAGSEEYQKVAAMMAPPTPSPMVTEGKACIADTLLPLALAKGEDSSQETQRRDVMAFLKDQGISAQNVQIIINNGLVPDEYLDRLMATLPPEEADGEWS